MLRTATLQEVANRLITKRQGHIVVVTRYYPRGLPRAFVHEYLASLAPLRPLLTEFKNAEKRLGHNEAFKAIAYVRKFALSAKGAQELERLSRLSDAKDVYLACFCSHGQFCHRDLLLLMAGKLFGAKTDRVKLAYSAFDPERAVQA